MLSFLYLAITKSSRYKSMRLMGKSIGLIQIDIPIDHQVGEGL